MKYASVTQTQYSNGTVDEVL